MRIIATIAVDLERSPIGTRSRLRDDLLGRPVLRRTVERVLRAKLLSGVHMLSLAKQADAVRAMLDGLDVRIETHSAGPAAYRDMVRAGRVWGLDAWRGGVGSLCVFDEDFHAPLLDALAKRTEAEAIMSISAAAALVDPELLDAMIAHHEENREAASLTLIQAPPGLGAFIIRRTLLAELVGTGLPPGALAAYQPTHPTPDPTGREACYRPPIEVIGARGRLLCDTTRSMARVKRLLKAGGESWNALTISRWLSGDEARRVEAVPEEIEIELTTEDPISDGRLLRPRGAAVGRRGPIGLHVIRRVAESIAGTDDVRIVLGGFGEPCRHPEFGAICRMLRESSAAAIAVRTNALEDDSAIEETLFQTPVDLIEVTLDAASKETYLQVNGVDAYEAVMTRLDRWVSRRTNERRVLPLIVPSMIKANETLDDLDHFFDTWQRRLGTLLVSGYSHHAGQRPRRAVTVTTPPNRKLCRRVFGLTLLLADGRLTTCDQDFAGRQIVGNLTETALPELWQNAEVLRDIRANTCGSAPLCSHCDQWHRP